MSTTANLWIVKYKPRRFSEIIGNRTAILEFRTWLEKRLKGADVEKAAFLWGPPGVGKTLTVEVAAIEYNLELIQMNASDARSRERIRRVLGMASQYLSLVGGRRKIILVDEVDGMSGTEDRGGLAAVIELIQQSRFPVVLTANDPWDPRFRPLRELCKMIRYDRIRVPTLVSYLRRICIAEGIVADDAALRIIAQRSDGDVRSAVNDLQAIAQGKKRLMLSDVEWLAYRDRQYGAFDVLKNIFAARTCRAAKAALASSLLDYNMIFQWIHENLPLQYPSPEDLAEAYDALSRADVFLGRTKRTQAWALLSYALDLMTAGVSMVKKGKYKFTKYQFPQRIKILSQTKDIRTTMNSICSAIAEKCHISTKGAVSEYLPYLRFIFRVNPEMAAGIAKWLKLDENMITFLAGSFDRANEIISLMRKRRKST
ncbi:MAG: replication factor C large subunit [Candidatus Methanomethylicota archaeon]|uniref:Replication factor C large subunit n=1 Tax=Thermoproteota archaeon TaxID=2056631 RepID=A0A497EZI8_9CREN|nr:MAG: replication factor C large subunit [Candidatus Verstraetearchaeota archaeon]